MQQMRWIEQRTVPISPPTAVMIGAEMLMQEVTNGLARVYSLKG